MKAYKGFNKDLTCRGFQYEEGKEYHEEKASLCNSGFHACEAPLDTFNYYAPGTSIYHEVELEDVSDKRDSDTKIVGKSIKIGARLDIAGICKAQFDFVKTHTTTEYTDPEKATAGEYGAATAGKYGAATAGYGGAATAGNRGAATAGEYGAATAGEYGAATAGEYGAATSRGSASVGVNGIASVRGNNVKARGGLGAILNITIEEDDNFDIKEWKAIVVDGEVIKADTFYILRDGEFIEVES